MLVRVDLLDSFLKLFYAVVISDFSGRLSVFQEAAESDGDIRNFLVVQKLVNIQIEVS